MGLDEVHKALMDVFPQVDYRVLRAVAFAHANDADAAVEAVLVEVIPFLSEDIIKSSSRNVSGGPSSRGASVTDQPNAPIWLESVHESLKQAENGENSRFVTYIDSSEESEDEEAISLRKGKGKSKARTLESLLSDSLGNMKIGAGAILSDLEDSEVSLPSVNGVIREDSDEPLPSGGTIIEEELCETSFPSETNFAAQECMENSQEGNSQLVVGPDTQVTVLEELETSTSSASSKKDLSTCEMVDLQDESTLNTMVSRSGYVCSIDLLEDLIEVARDNKKTLVSAMDSVISLAREVELQEKAAEEARVEASRGSVDVHNKVQELTLALLRAKEANDMHAGEVYAEKAVLTTEAKELQSRLLSLSDERDRSLRILDEMRESLEVRLSAAQKEFKAALQEKEEKEASAREALAMQERIMEEVVQESKLLKQEAEENSKLQDFLMDRGRVVDMLQGEISVKCQDVKLLKEKFDSRVPLTTSLYSSTFSRSSSRSMSPPLHVPNLAASYDKLQKTDEFVDSFDTLQNNTELNSYPNFEQGARVADSSEAMEPSVTTPHNEHLFYRGGDEKASAGSKVLVEEDWDLI